MQSTSAHISSVSGPVDDIRHRTPYAEGVGRRHTYLGEVGVGGNEPSLVAPPYKALEGVLAIELAYRHLALRGVAAALVYDDDVARVDVGVYHRVALDAYEIRCFGVGAEHAQEVDVLAALVVVERYGEARHQPYVEVGQREVVQLGGAHHDAHPPECCGGAGSLSDASGDKLALVGLAVYQRSHLPWCPEGKEFAVCRWSSGALASSSPSAVVVVVHIAYIVFTDKVTYIFEYVLRKSNIFYDYLRWGWPDNM